METLQSWRPLERPQDRLPSPKRCADSWRKRFTLNYKITRDYLNAHWQKNREAFKSFPLKIKLSIIIALIVIFVVSMMSLIVLQSEKKLLKERLEETCNISVKSLSYYIKGNLLVRRDEDIMEMVLRLKKLGIAGLEQAWVINREGVMVAHSEFTNNGGAVISQDKLNWLLNLNDMETYETETSFEYYYPIFITKIEGEQEKNIRLGVTGLSFSKDIVLRPVRTAQRLILTLAFIIILVSIMGIYFLAQRMVSQIQALSEGAKQVGQGNLDVKIKINTRDELGRLGEEFNNMILHLKEKLQMQKFVSKMTVQMIRDQVTSREPPGGSKKKNITVFFSDIRNFTSISGKLDPEEAAELLNIYLDLQARIIQKNTGIVDKFMGDRIMAIFDGERMVDNALKAAVSIQRAIREVNKKRLQAKKVTLDVGIGLNNGTAVVGNIGTHDRMDYTFVGSVIDLASRLCDVAKPGQIITAKDLLRKLNGNHHTIKLEPIFMKGLSKPVEIYEIDYS